MPIATKITKPLFFMFLFVIILLLFNGAMTSAATLYIIGELGGDAFLTSSYATTFFSVGNGLTMPLAVCIGPRFGLKRVYIVCLQGFFVTSLLCGFATNYPLFIVARFLQGAATGPLFVLTTLMLGKIATEEQRSTFMSWVLLSFIAVPAFSSAVGGTFAYFSHWRTLFFLDALFLGVVVLVVYWVWRRYVFEREYVPFDGVGYFSYVVGITALFAFLILGQQLDWFRSSFLTVIFIVGWIFFLFFVVWTSKHPHPILKLSLLKQGHFLVILVHLAVLFGTYYGTVILLSLWLKLFANYSVAWINIVMGTMAVTSFLVMWTIQQVKRQRKGLMLFLAIALLAFSCFYTTQFDAEIDLFRIGISRIIAGVGIALFLPPIFYSIMMGCGEEERFNALTWYQVVRTYGTALGVIAYTIIWQRRDSFFHDRLGSELTIYSEKVEGFYAKLSPFDLSPMQKVAALSDTLSRQAQALALDDSFYFMGWVLVALGLLWLGWGIYRVRTEN